MMHCGNRLLTSGIRLFRWRQQRLLSASSYVVKSSLPDVELPNIALPDYVWQRVDQWPDKVAVECAVTGRRYRYAEMRQLCRRFAASLGRVGLQPGDTLNIVMPNTAEWPIVFLGAMEAGLVITTTNPHYTREEMSRQLRDCQPKAIVTLSAVFHTVQEAIKLTGTPTKPLIVIAPGVESSFDLPAGTVDLRQMLQDSVDTSHVRFTGNIDDIAILPYSSGTTGLPKGVMLSHRNIVSNIAQENDRHELCPTVPALGSHQDIVPAVLPFYHTFGLAVVLLGKLVHGCKIVTLPKFEPTSFFKLLDQHQATILYAAPPIVLFLASHPGMLPKYLQSLRHVIIGAAPLGGLDAERFLKIASPSTSIVQGYGLTESSGITTHMMRGSSKYESVGGPIPNTEMKVVHQENRSDLAARQKGEICMRGPQVMMGYFNRPTDTADVIDSENWFYTGDLGYYDEDGHFYVLDRLKEMIKVKGYQVAPAELEEILRSHPDIEDAGVVGVPDDRAGEVPRAFVVPRRPGISEEDVKKFVAANVVEYKQLKGGVQFLTSIPKNPSGKILRRELKALL